MQLRLLYISIAFIFSIHYNVWAGQRANSIRLSSSIENVYEYENTTQLSNPASSPIVKVDEGTIKISVSGQADIKIYNIHGQLVANNPNVIDNFVFKPKQPGIYLVKVNEKTIKTVVR